MSEKVLRRIVSYIPAILIFVFCLVMALLSSLSDVSYESNEDKCKRIGGEWFEKSLLLGGDCVVPHKDIK